MQKVMLSLARRAAEASMQPLHEARDLSQQYDVRLRAKDITTYQQSLADTLQFDEDEAQVDSNIRLLYLLSFTSFINSTQRKKLQPLPQIVISPFGTGYYYYLVVRSFCHCDDLLSVRSSARAVGTVALR